MRHLAQALRGWFLPVLSHPGIGTIFAMEVPLPRAAAAEAADESSSGARSHRVDEDLRAVSAAQAAPGAVTLVPAAAAVASSFSGATPTPADEMAALLALIGGVEYAHPHAALPAPVPLVTRGELAPVSVAGIRVLLIDDDLFVLAVARGVFLLHA